MSTVRVGFSAKREAVGFSAKREAVGFTLIELMIAIAIVGIISAVGFASYSQSQLIARDAKRKQDLRAIATALELYYQTNNRYPCTSGINEGLQTSTPSQGFFWIQDTDVDGAGGLCGNAQFDTKYINQMPIDPLKNSGNPKGGERGYAYFSRGDCGNPYNNPGYFYALITRLENKDDPDSLGKKDVYWCDGLTLKDRWANDLFVITSL